jgi:phage-related protein
LFIILPIACANGKKISATTITTNIVAKVSAISNAAPPSFMLILSLPQIINNGIATNIKITMKLDKRSFTSQQ